MVIFLLGMFWKRATEAGALSAAVGSVALSFVYWEFYQSVPFMNRMGYVFLICLGLAVIVSLMRDVSQMHNVHAACQQLTALGIRVFGAVVSGMPMSTFGKAYQPVQKETAAAA